MSIQTFPIDNIRLLLIDDNDADCTHLKRLLQPYSEAFAKIEYCNSIDSALELLEHDSFDCCLLDFYLQGDSGIRLLELLCNNSQYQDKQAPAIVSITGHDDSQISTQMLKAGALDYLVKGEFDGVQLFNVITKAIRTNQLSFEVHHLAHYDELTGLENRALFMKHLEHALALADRNGNEQALIFIDIDYFKSINDTHGHDVGDFLLKECASRIRNSCRKTDHVARFGGDEFVVLLIDIDPAKTHFVAQKILREISKPMTFDSLTLKVTPSMGFSQYPSTAHNAPDLLKQADNALYTAKRNGRAQYRKFSSNHMEEWSKEIKLKQSLPRALHDAELDIDLEPVMNLHKATLRAFNPKLCWKTSGRVIPHQQLIMWSRELDIEISLYRYYFQKSCHLYIEQLQSIRNNINPSLAFSIEGKDHLNDNLLAAVTDVITKNGLNPNQIYLEIDASYCLEDICKSQCHLDAIKAQGYNITLSHFGGPTSPLNLVQLPIDQLKMDVSELEEMNAEDVARFIQSATLFGVSLQLEVLVEGVHSDELFNTVHQANCHLLQGRHFIQDAYQSQRQRSLYMLRPLFG